MSLPQATLQQPDDQAPFLEWATYYAQLGHPVFPLHPKTKDGHICKHGCLEATTDPKQISTWWRQGRNRNIGIASGHISFVVDVDVKSGGKETLEDWYEKYGRFPDTLSQITGSGGVQFFFSLPADFEVRNSQGTLGDGIDVRGTGGYSVVAPSIHPNGNAYVWDGLEPVHEQKILPAPEWLLNLIREAQAKSSHGDPNGPRLGPAPDVIAKGVQHDTLFKHGCSLRAKGYTEKEIFGLLWQMNLDRCEEPGPEADIRKLAESICKQFARGSSPKVTPIRTDPETKSEPAPDLLFFQHNDYGNSMRIVAMFGKYMRYCPETRCYFVWDGRRWKADKNGQATRNAKLCMLEFLKQAVAAGAEAAEKFAKASLEMKRIKSMLEMAQSEIYFMASELDTHPHLLNCKNATVNLETGEEQPHSPDDFITKLANHNHNRNAQCPTFLNFLNEIMGGGPDASEADLNKADRMTGYLQKVFGYALTGITSEKAVFAFIGEKGDNGKTTLLNTIREIIPEYSVLLQVDTLMTRQESNNTQADLADLRGARFVQTSETEDGQRLAQGKLKRITQGMGKIKAVRKYENPIEFPETHKLFLDTNKRPTITDATDQATFNRLHPIPFDVKIPPERIDRKLPGKLAKEAEGVLAWMVKGSQLWFQTGIQRPSEVDAARKDWQGAMDQVAQFIEENCSKGDSFSCSASVLYKAYAQWMEDRGEHAITGTAFGIDLGVKGFDKGRSNSGLIYKGLTLRNTKVNSGRD